MSFIEGHAIGELNAQLTQMNIELNIRRSHNDELKRKLLENLRACPVDEITNILELINKELEEKKKLHVAKHVDI
jgi:hypothetical protein